jgi:hypothetical protein
LAFVLPMSREDGGLINRGSRYSPLNDDTETFNTAAGTAGLDDLDLDTPPEYSRHSPIDTRSMAPARGRLSPSKQEQAFHHTEDQKHAYSAVPIEETESAIRSTGTSTSASTSAPERPIEPESTDEEIRAADQRRLWAAIGQMVTRSGSGYGFRDTRY